MGTRPNNFPWRKSLVPCLVLLAAFSPVLNAWPQETVVAHARDLARAGGKDRAEALRILEGRLADRRADTDALTLYGIVLSWEARYDDARVQLTRVLDKYPAHGDALPALINVELWSGHPERAEQLARGALTFRPNDPNLLFFEAQALENMHQDAEAAKALDRIIILQPENDQARRMRGSIHERLQISESALSYSPALPRSNPSSPAVVVQSKPGSTAGLPPPFTVAYGLGLSGGQEEFAPAATPGTDSLIVAGEWNHFVPAVNGGNGSVDWVHAGENGRTYTGGVAVFAISNSHWAFGRVGASFRPRPRFTLQGQASVGGGSTPGAEFYYQIYEGGLSYKVSQRLYLKFADEYIRIAATHGSLLKTGIIFVPARRLATDFTYAHSAGGNVGTEFFAGRFDVNVRKITVLSGFAVGRATPEIFNVNVGRAPLQRDLREGFVGFRAPLSRFDLTLVADILNLNATHKRSLTVSFKLPIRKR